MAKPLILRFGAETEGARQQIGALAQAVAASMGTVSSVMAVAAANSNLAGQAALSGASAVGKFAIAWQAVQVAAALAAAAFVAAGLEMAKAVEIAGKARETGVGTTFFQVFTKQSESLRVEVKLLEEALRNAEVAGRSRFERDAPINTPLRYIQGQTGATFGPDAQRGADAALSANTQEERITRVLELMRTLEREGERLAAIDLGEKMFGTSFMDKVRTGRQSIADVVSGLESDLARAASTSSIIPPDVIERAEELTKRLQDAWKVIDDALRPAFVDLARLGGLIYEGMVPLVELFSSLIGLAGRLYEVMRSVAGLVASVTASPLLNGAANAADPGRARTLEQEVATLRQRIVGEARSGADGMERARGLTAQLITKEAELARLQQTIAARGPIGSRDMGVVFGPNQPPPSTNVAQPPTRPPGLGASPGRSSGRSEEEIRQEQIERGIEQLEGQNRMLEAEAGLIHSSKQAREAAIAVARIGNDLTQEQRDRIEELVTANMRYRESIEAVEARQRSVNDLVRFAGQTMSGFLSDIISGGKNAEQAIMNLTKRLVDMSLQAIIIGDGPLAGLFGTQGRDGKPGGILGSLFGGLGTALFGGGPTLPASLYHSGGVIGTGAPVTVPAAVFDGAQRAHSGRVLGPSEVPIIAELGEEVLTKRQRQNIASAMQGGGSNVVVNISTPQGTKTQSSQRSDGRGGSVLDIMIEQVEGAISGNIGAGRGPLGPALEGAYGLGRRGV